MYALSRDAGARMLTFYLEARPHMNGGLVEFTIYQGSHAGTKRRLGEPTYFERVEWEAFRTLIIAGIKNSRIPTELHDGTRRKD